MPNAPDRPGRTDDTNVVVYHGEERDRGAPIEPEEQHAEVVQPLDLFVTIGRRHLARDVPLHELPASVQDAAARAVMRGAHVAHQTTAGELATIARVRCINCVHFNPEGWMKVKRDAEASGDKDRLLDLNVIRGMIEQTQNLHLREMHDDGAGGLNLEAALNCLGQCMAMTEHFKDEIFVHPLSSCPSDAPFFFQPKRSFYERRAASSTYDWILRAAEKGPR